MLCDAFFLELTALCLGNTVASSAVEEMVHFRESILMALTEIRTCACLMQTLFDNGGTSYNQGQGRVRISVSMLL